MKQLTLNKCLSELDTIIFCDYEKDENVYEIRQILNDVRIYIIDSTLVNNKKYNKRSFMVILEFINYWIQESFGSITNQFINHILGLVFLIIKFEGDYLQISHEKIGFDEECNSFLKNYLVSEDEDENWKIDVFLYKRFKSRKTKWFRTYAS